MASLHAKLLDIVRSGSDLTFRQIVLLMECRTGQQTVRGLAEKLNTAKPSITRAADKLAELEFVQRKDDEEDRRSVFIVITPKGRRFIDGLEPS